MARQPDARMRMLASSRRAMRGARAHPPAARPGSSDARPCTAAPLARVFCSEIVRLVRKGSPPTQGSVWFILNRLSTCAPGARVGGAPCPRGRAAQPRDADLGLCVGQTPGMCSTVPTVPSAPPPAAHASARPHAPARPAQPDRQAAGRDPTGLRLRGAAHPRSAPGGRQAPALRPSAGRPRCPRIARRPEQARGARRAGRPPARARAWPSSTVADSFWLRPSRLRCA